MDMAMGWAGGVRISASAISFRLKAILFAMVLAVEIGFAFLEGPMVRISPHPGNTGDKQSTP
jgi:hypothetical protein